MPAPCRNGRKLRMNSAILVDCGVDAFGGVIELCNASPWFPVLVRCTPPRWSQNGWRNVRFLDNYSTNWGDPWCYRKLLLRLFTRDRKIFAWKASGVNLPDGRIFLSEFRRFCPVITKRLWKCSFSRQLLDQLRWSLVLLKALTKLVHSRSADVGLEAVRSCCTGW